MRIFFKAHFLSFFCNPEVVKRAIKITCTPPRTKFVSPILSFICQISSIKFNNLNQFFLICLFLFYTDIWSSKKVVEPFSKVLALIWSVWLPLGHCTFAPIRRLSESSINLWRLILIWFTCAPLDRLVNNSFDYFLDALRLHADFQGL